MRSQRQAQPGCRAALRRIDTHAPMRTEASTYRTGSRSILVSFSGIDGAGKSTQIDKFCKLLKESGLTVKQLAFWDNVVAFSRFRAGFSHRFLDSESGVGSPEKPVNRQDKNVRKWYLTVPRAALYSVDAVNLRRAVTAAKAERPDVIVFDRYIYDQLATLPLHMSIAVSYVQALLKIAPRPDVAYLLDADPEAARARKPEYPVEFLQRYRASYLRLSELADLTLIPPMAVEEVHRAILREFAGCTNDSIPASNLKPLAPA